MDAVRADPLLALADEYVSTTLSVLRVLRPIVVDRGDVEVIEAVEAIEWLAGLVTINTSRAVTGLNDLGGSPDDEGEPDANRSAQIARFVIAESRRAWLVLMELGRAAANGVPARAVLMLDQLGRAIAARFPAEAAWTRRTDER